MLQRISNVLGILIVLWMFSGCSDEAETDKASSDGAAKADSTKVDSAKVAKNQKRKRPPKPKETNKNQRKKVVEGVPVKVSVVETGEISDHVLYSATVEAEETIDIYARGAGLVRRVLVEEGIG